ncbi:MAG TPA: type II toxin-antitoxin system RelE/ParE family toxin [Pyrinomonadaceae bacterium]|nr:type II toxin-antitoxin system RelE/ParE family toxin [Pyrinomonadaceae bacterium]
MSSKRFHVEYTSLAVENLRALPKTVAAQIIRKTSRLENGLTANIKRLREADFGYRLRMGDYRILFDVEGDTIGIQKIGHRKDIHE